MERSRSPWSNEKIEFGIMSRLRKILDTELKPTYFYPFIMLFASPLILQFDWVNARDASVYSGAITNLLNGINPYEDGVFRGGLFGAVPLFLIAQITPLAYEAIVFLLLNVIGTILFLRVVLLPSRSLKNLIVYLIVVYSSSSREGLNTIQITGIILGLLAIIIKCYGYENTIRKQLPMQILSISAAAIAIDLKPHFVGPALLIYFIRFKLLKIGLLVFSLIAISHFVIDVVFKTWFTLDWARLLLSLAGREVSPSRAEFVNVWSIFSSFTGDIRVLNFIPMILILGIFLVTLRIGIIGKLFMWAIGFALPLLSTFNHYYDYLPLVAICITSLFTRRVTTLSYFYLGISTLTLNLDNVYGLLLVVVFLGFLFIDSVAGAYSASWKSQMSCFLRGISLFILYHLILNQLENLGVEELAIGSTLILAASFLLLLRNKENSQRREI